MFKSILFKILVYIFALIGILALFNSCSPSSQKLDIPLKKPVVIIGLQKHTDYENGTLTLVDADGKCYTFFAYGKYSSFTRSICNSRKVGDTLFR